MFGERRYVDECPRCGMSLLAVTPDEYRATHVCPDGVRPRGSQRRYFFDARLVAAFAVAAVFVSYAARRLSGGR